ncbi:hypothetical protein DM860_002999 [Cuscuta australis]|uniref:Uncharacterized protein n=1 Tax=Cuscuta australis TaxID=267555 RepID=A0A328D1U7_9ASTE|nr:hypothetical protein DM860_002999 [Cuscuta australis]
MAKANCCPTTVPKIETHYLRTPIVYNAIPSCRVQTNHETGLMRKPSQVSSYQKYPCSIIILVVSLIEAWCETLCYNGPTVSDSDVDVAVLYAHALVGVEDFDPQQDRSIP